MSGREYNRHWREENREHRAAYQREWKARNRERSLQLNRESMRRQAALDRMVRRKREIDRRRYWRNPEGERERARQFRREHPDRVRQYQRTYREKHPDRARQHGRQASTRWRDKNAETRREAQRIAAAKRRAQDPGAYADWYRRNLERERARGREASRLRGRLRALGLPPRHVQRVYADRKRANAAAATDFFTRRRTAEARRRIRVEADATAKAEAQAAAAHDAAVRARLTETARLVRRRRVEPDPSGLDPPTPPDLLRAFLARSALARDRHALREAFPRLLADQRRLHGDRVREEVRIDSAARVSHRRPPFDVERETEMRLCRLACDAFHATRTIPRMDRDLLLASEVVEAMLWKVRTREWWQEASRADVATILLLARDPAAGPEETRLDLLRRLNRGAIDRWGQPAVEIARNGANPSGPLQVSGDPGYGAALGR